MEMLISKQEKDVTGLYNTPERKQFGPLNTKVYQDGYHLGDKFCKIVSKTYLEYFDVDPITKEQIEKEINNACKTIYEQDWDSWFEHYLFDFVDHFYNTLKKQDLYDKIVSKFNVNEKSYKFVGGRSRNDEIMSEVYSNLYSTKYKEFEDFVKEYNELRRKQESL